MDIQNKIHIRITGDGYLINPDYPIAHQKLPFGEIVRRNMSAYHERQSKVPLERLADVGQSSVSDKIAILKRATNLAKTGGIRARIDEAIKYLPLLMENRAEFLRVFSPNLSTLFSNPIEVKNIWNTAEKKIVQELYVLDLDDLLLYDIGKVIEYNIYIFPCAYCGEYFIRKRKQERYCSAHRKIGQEETRKKNFEADRCRKLGKKIYDRLKNRYDKQRDATLSARYQQELYAYRDEWEELRDKYNAGLISEKQFYNWLNDQEAKTMIYEKHK